ncbi:MAG TPA: nucleotidyltransferase domain-containing protein [Anaerolineae bacterium]|nr:nucleotidyltransferase domain-containing protein [Anaerolineae bacterium]
MNYLTEQDRQAVIEFVARLKSRFASKLHGVVLYGSKARGEATADSDIDLLVILDTRNRENRAQVNKAASRVSLAFDVLLLPHVFSWELWQEMADAPFFFFREVFRDGWPVYGDPAVFAPLARRDMPPLYDDTAVTA